MNRYILSLITLFFISSSHMSIAEDDTETKQGTESAKALVELESRNDEVPTDEDRAEAAKKEAEKQAEAKPLVASVDRAWGLLLGDELTITVDTSTSESGINDTSLPPIEKRYGTWLYLKQIEMKEKTLEFHYQVVNVPGKNTAIETPPFDIKQNNEKWLVIPSVSLSIGPALATAEGISNLELKADSKPTLINTDKMASDFKRYAIIAVIAWLLLALWHFGWKTKNRNPFAQAVHDLGRLRWKRSVSPDDASRILHTAFNRTSNTIVVYGEIDNLLEGAPWLSSLQDDIKDFYQQSEQHFFARQAGQEPDLELIKKLAKACRAKEMLA